MFLAEEMNGDLLNHLVVTQTMILIQSVQWSDATQKCSHANDHFSRKWLAEMNNNLQCNEFFIDSNRKLPLLQNCIILQNILDFLHLSLADLN